MVWFRCGCSACCGWNVRCVGVRGDAWLVLLSPCNTYISLPSICQKQQHLHRPWHDCTVGSAPATICAGANTVISDVPRHYMNRTASLHACRHVQFRRVLTIQLICPVRKAVEFTTCVETIPACPSVSSLPRKVAEPCFASVVRERPQLTMASWLHAMHDLAKFEAFGLGLNVTTSLLLAKRSLTLRNRCIV